jgi:arsenate reductase (thioredoxin)
MREMAMGPTRTILFLCPHNAAKSVLAAAYFDTMAVERGLPFRADSAGTEPDEQPSPAVVAALQADGIDVAGHQPRLVTVEDLASAYRVISLGCDVESLVPSYVRVDRWDDVPPASRDLAASRKAIRCHLDAFFDELAAERPYPSATS